jgi:hypothetical protein
MSAALLQDNEKCNELEDDRESCLHVLTWTALCLTKHTISKGRSSDFLRDFDEEYENEDGVKGGALQKGFLVAREIPRVIKFDRRPHLDKLIEELTETCAVHYEKPPSARDLQALEDALQAHVPESVMTNLPAFSYRKRLDDLASPSWHVDTFCSYLDADIWPPSDKAKGSSLVLDLIRNGRGSRASWSSRFCV